MTDIGFYHLTRSTLAQALPQLLTRALAAEHRALVLGPTVTYLDALSVALWAQPAWLPHGTETDGDADLQPIWLSINAEPLNGARYLFLVGGTKTDLIAGYERAFDIFDGNLPEAVVDARDRWKTAKATGHSATYWQQTETNWQKKR